MRRGAIRRRRRLQLSIFPRATQRFVGHAAPEAYAF
jgi:hypothetical protein